jgi:ribosomal-protein-alanine N-acetyltransferase
MLEINFGAFPELETTRLLLRSMQLSDAEILYTLRSDPRVMRYFDGPFMPSTEAAHQFIQKVLDMFAQSEGIQWAITLKNDPTMIGTITFWKIDKEHHRAIVGYLLHPDHQGQGLMQEALGAILPYGFEQLHLHSIQADVNPNNTASMKLLERMGFVREAHFRENFYFDGKFLDTVVYSLLSTTPYRRL